MRMSDNRMPGQQLSVLRICRTRDTDAAVMADPRTEGCLRERDARSDNQNSHSQRFSKLGIVLRHRKAQHHRRPQHRRDLTMPRRGCLRNAGERATASVAELICEPQIGFQR